MQPPPSDKEETPKGEEDAPEGGEAETENPSATQQAEESLSEDPTSPGDDGHDDDATQ